MKLVPEFAVRFKERTVGTKSVKLALVGVIEIVKCITNPTPALSDAEMAVGNYPALIRDRRVVISVSCSCHMLTPSFPES